jgi:hypothetical protein
VIVLQPQEINELQNDSAHLRLLEAADAAHQRASNIESARWLTIAALTFATFVVLFIPDWSGYAAIGGLFASVLTEFLWPFFGRAQNRRAALVQEMFDTSLFGLVWSNELGMPLTASEVSRLHVQYGGTSPKNDWYMDVSGVPSPIAELSCQRENLLWDGAIRQEWAWRLALTTGALAGLGILTALFLQWTVFELLTSFLAPAAPLFAALIVAVHSHRKVANLKLKLRIDLDKELHRIEPSTITTSDVTSLRNLSRQLQSKIFESRCETVRVPQSFYKKRRNQYEIDHAAESDAVRAIWAFRDLG